MQQPHHDIMGMACTDYLAGQNDAKIKVRSNIAEDDFIPVSYLFRTFTQMPAIEQKALGLCRGKVLDVGAGAGSHALWLQQNGVDVYALDHSPGLCKTMAQRGVANVMEGDYFDLTTDQKYDTLLFLMNGIGIVGSVDRLGEFFEKAKALLAPNGQILLDSCDIAYLFDDPETEHLPETMKHYYGEIRYQMAYKQAKGNRFGWLFIDPKLLSYMAAENGLRCEIVMEGENGGYLARMFLF
jgi:2-polyprenyl-3-methyl-5-hydroxy-6-metoxy-1,4-benzoquinol methylase